MSSYASISSKLTLRLSSSNNLDQFVRGLTDNYLPQTQHEYNNYRRFMHDVLCLGLVESGFYSSEHMTIQALGIGNPMLRFANQCPDLWRPSDDVIKVGEVSFTYDKESTFEEKSSKYNELFMYIEEMTSKKILYQLHIIDLSTSEWRSGLPDCPKTHEELISRMVDNLRLIHATPKGSQFARMQQTGEEFRFEFKPDMSVVYRQICDTLAVSRSEDNMKLIENLTMNHDEDLETSEDYLSEMADAVLTKSQSRPYPEFSYGNPQPFYEEFETQYINPPPTTEKLPVILQLGAPTKYVGRDYANRRLMYNDFRNSEFLHGYGLLVKLWCKENVVDAEWDGRLELKLSDSQLQLEMKSGPGRKKYYKMMNMNPPREAPKHIGVRMRHTKDVMDFLDDIRDLGMSSDDDGYEMNTDFEFLPMDQSSKKVISQMQDKISDDGTSNLLQFYTKISREIIINAMRRRGKREYVLCHSGYEGIFVLLAPGPQLRTESNVIFAKIISSTPGLSSFLSRSWTQLSDNHYESDWLSVDTDRLKHWACAEERVILSLLGNAEKLVNKDMSYFSAISTEVNTKNYALLASIYLENKQTTSTTIQTSRYVMMKTLGDRQYKGVLAKFPERVNSVLQSFVLQRLLQYVKECSTFKTLERATNRQIVRDDMTGLIDESTAGVIGLLPRIFTFGGPVPIQYNINEIYWCMMYNKDRQNKTQDSMKILKKIVKEEVKLDEELASRKSEKSKILHYFGIHTSREDMNHILSQKPESHYYSKRYVNICAKLQASDKHNHGAGGTWLTKQKINKILNKNLSEYATFKASVNHIKEFVDQGDLDSVKEIGRRTKCIELVHQLISDENLVTVKDVIMQSTNVDFMSTFNILIQIFKKNQVGGVREILILYIKARILINVTEEICKLLATADSRETLTKGKDKRLMMRGDFDELSSSLPAGTPMIFVKNSYDMATWCQKFIPTIFLSIFNVNKEELEDVHTLSCMVLLKHCMKKIEFPAALVKQWMLHPEKKHDEPGMQALKEEFQRSGKTHMVNKSNMGQGILHYGSTVIGVYCQSGRDKLFKICLEKLGQKQCISWRTRLGSDDKGDVIALDLRDPNCHFQAKLLDQCSRASERLCSIELSVKSASGCLLYEFNSAFMANLEVQSPIIKFTLASCDLINTDSCTRFVNESFSRIRQLKENGASSLLCSLAHLFNRRMFYSVFQTNEGMKNDVSRIMNLDHCDIPYDFGVYPFFDSDLNELLGPEYHNYQIFKRNPSSRILNMLLRDISNEEEVDHFTPQDDQGLFKKDVFGIGQGLIRQLENMKERLGVTSDQVLNYLKHNPFLIIRGPMTQQESKMLVASKLCTRGASESLRRTSPAIYLGRMSAFATARAWKVEGEEAILTYEEYLNRVFMKSKPVDYSSFSSLIYPNQKTFDVAEPYIGKYGPMQRSKRNYAQAVRIWTLNSYNYNFTTSLRAILETSMGLSNEAPLEDVRELRRSVPFEMTSYDGFIKECVDRDMRPVDVFFYLNKFYKLSNEKKAQIFAYGPSTSSWINTLSANKTYNHIHGSTMVIDSLLPEEQVDQFSAYFQDLEVLKLGFNFRLMESQGLFDTTNILDHFHVRGVTFSEHLKTIIRNVKTLRSLDGQTKKVCLFMASQLLDRREFMDKLISWRQINYSYLKRQNQDKYGNWIGDLSVLVSYCNEVFIVNCTNKEYHVDSRRISDLRDFQEALNKICKTLGLTLSDFVVNSRSRPDDIILRRNNFEFATRNMKYSNRLKIVENQIFKFKALSDFSNFMIVSERNKDDSVSIKITEPSGIYLTLCHFPGHYYPTNIPKSITYEGDHRLCGVPMKYLIQNKAWFIDGKLPLFGDSDTLRFLKDVDFRSLFEKITKSNVEISSYIEDYRINELTRMAEEYEFNNEEQNLSDEELTQAEVDTILNATALEVIADDRFYYNAVGSVTQETMDLINNFTSALGENTTIARRKEFFTISNLRTTANFKFKVLNLFFEGGDIAYEKKDTLPEILLYLHRKMREGQPIELLKQLHNYTMEKVCVNFGKSKDVMAQLMDNLSRTSRRGRQLKRFESYMSDEDDTIADMIENL
jgi:hypothetical protein